MGFEQCLHELSVLVDENGQHRLVSKTSTEADTRAKVITRILTRVLDWPEAAIVREEKSSAGYLDYKLSCPRPTLVVEAKRSGQYFTFPAERNRRQYALSTLSGEKAGVGKAIRQVRGYCDDHGTEYACVTNGSQWIVFQAITAGRPWKAGRGIVFRSLEDIHANFTEFWNLLGYEPVSHGSLVEGLGDAQLQQVTFKRVLDTVYYADNPLQRNRLSRQIQPLISGMFRDLTGPEEDEVLKKCYVYDRRVQGVWKEVRALFNDTLPEFARRSGFSDLVETEDRSGALDADFRKAVRRGDFGTTVLLLGGIGAGKTTFIH